MKIFNIDGTSDNKCNCESWLQYWENYSGQSLPSCCSVKNCDEKPEVGAHVQKASYDKDWYIVPLCKSCNVKKGGTLEINDYVALVSANVNETCG